MAWHSGGCFCNIRSSYMAGLWLVYSDDGLGVIGVDNNGYFLMDALFLFAISV